MTRTELIIQLLKVVIGLAFGAYFVWWSLEVLDRLTPDNEVPAAVVGRAFSRSPPRQSGWRGYGRSRSGNAKIGTPTHGYEATRDAAMAAFAPTPAQARKI
jgi:hypothetical protein